jgi:hypothetical protein
MSGGKTNFPEKSVDCRQDQELEEDAKFHKQWGKYERVKKWHENITSANPIYLTLFYVEVYRVNLAGKPPTTNATGQVRYSYFCRLNGK